MSRAIDAMAVLALTSATVVAAPGCSLLYSPDDHLGGTSMDGGLDGGPRDGAIEPDAPVDLDAAGVDAAAGDAGQDAGPPLPECTMDSECGAVGRARCVSGRCQFCAMPLASPVLIDSGMGFVRHFGMGVGSAGGTAEIGIAWITHPGSTGLAPAAAFHATSVATPTAPSGLGNMLGPLESISGVSFPRMTSVQVGVSSYAGSQDFDIAVLGARLSPASTIRTYIQFGGGTYTSGTYPGADYVDAPAADLAPLAIVDEGGIFGAAAVRRTRRADGTVALAAAEIGYGNNVGTPFESADLPATDYEPIATVGHLAVVGGATDARIVVWDLGDTDGVSLDTPGRTSNPAIAQLSSGDYLIAYGAGSAIHVRGMECTGTAATCTLLTGTTVIETGAERVSLVQLAVSDDVPVIVSHDATASGTGGRLALRVLRPDRTPYDAPGGGTALALETFPGGSTRIVPDVDLGIGVTSAGPYYVASWMRTAAPADAMVDLRLQSIAAACPP